MARPEVSGGALPAPAPAAVSRVNIDRWRRGRFVRQYGGGDLRPVEAALIDRFRDELSGRVLELGCGAGRLTGHLIGVAEHVEGIDISSRMVLACERRYPAARFRVGDLRDLSAYENDSFDAVWASFNVLDVFGDADRRLALREAHRVLRPGGLLLMSSHNRAFLAHLRHPLRPRTVDPLRFAVDVARAPVAFWRHRRLVPFQRQEPDYALVSDGSHTFSLIHYFTTPGAQRRQLEQEGFEPLLCLDLQGGEVGGEEADPGCPELHYTARAVGE